MIKANIQIDESKIDKVINSIKAFKSKNKASILFVFISIYAISKIINKHKKEITNLKQEIGEYESKGE